MFYIIFIDKSTGEVIDQTTRPNFSTAVVCCMANETSEISCLIKEGK